MTTLDFGARRSGKTTRAVLWALGDRANRVIVVPAFAMKQHIAKVVTDCGYEPGDVAVITFFEYMRSPGMSEKQYWIDELRMCLPGNVAGASGLK